MKKYIITAIVALVLIAAIVILWMQLASVKKELRDTRTELSVKTSETQTYRDENGNLHAKVDQYGKHVSELKKSNDSIEQAMYANARAAGIKDRQIQSLKYALFESRDSIIGLIKIFDNIDSVDVNDVLVYYNRKIYFDNDNLKVEVIVPLLETKPYVLTYSYATEVFMTERWYRPKAKFFLWRWLGMSFQKKQNEFDFRVGDSNAVITVTRDVLVE